MPIADAVLPRKLSNADTELVNAFTIYKTVLGDMYGKHVKISPDVYVSIAAWDSIISAIYGQGFPQYALWMGIY